MVLGYVSTLHEGIKTSGQTDRMHRVFLFKSGKTELAKRLECDGFAPLRADHGMARRLERALNDARGLHPLVPPLKEEV